VTETAPRTRRQTKREQPEVRAERARTLLDDPNVREVFKQARQELVVDIERVKLDGSEVRNNEVLELVRQLHALNSVQRIILRPLVAEMVKAQGRKRSLN
jgi:hypothetical protein